MLHVDGELADAPDSQRVRVSLVALLLLGETLLIAFSYDALTLTAAQSPSWFQWIGYSGYLLKTVLAMIAALLLGLGPSLAGWGRALTQVHAVHGWRALLAAHLIAFTLLWWSTDLIFGFGPGSDTPPTWAPMIWLISVPATFGTWLLVLAPLGFWVGLVRTERLPMALAAAIGPLALIVAMTAQELWAPLGKVTLNVCAWLLGQVYADITVDYETAVLGTGDFLVRIGAQCSGYEGIGLVTLFTAIYLSVFRRDFRFPNALLLFPLGIVTIWIFNALRIVLLIAIGAEVSPAIAVGGFHSQAGWIMFIVVAVSILLAADRMAFFSARGEASPRREASHDGPAASALLVPLVVLLATTLLTQAFAAEHDWLYPLRVVATAVAIGWSFNRIGSLIGRPSLSVWPVAGGLAVFAIWLWLVPNQEDADAGTAAILADSHGVLVVVWLAFRFIGSVITVPIAEELAFRGYLIHRLTATPLDRRPRFSWFALLASSVAFGLLHSAWLAGLVAGLVYGLVRYHRNQLADAIVAHAVTNLLLSLYVLSFGAWSLW
ncbi:MAG TPA: exosortase E/protease, VPEID-CTERM system [Pseudomonadales bacterium]